MRQVQTKKLFVVILILIAISIISGCKNSADESTHQAELLRKADMEKEQTITEEEKIKNIVANDLKSLSEEKRIEISLPWSKEEEIIGFMPLGETEIHEPPGHPGICVGWTHNASIIASADGIISIKEDDEIPGLGLSIVKEISGQYIISYKHINVNPELKEGATIKKGDLIGYPMVKHDERMTNYAFHWDIFPNVKTEIILSHGLCPVTYLDNESRQRLERVWENDPSEYKKRWPKICNGYYDGVDSFMSIYNKSFTPSGEIIKWSNEEIVNKKY